MHRQLTGTLLHLQMLFAALTREYCNHGCYVHHCCYKYSSPASHWASAGRHDRAGIALSERVCADFAQAGHQRGVMTGLVLHFQREFAAAAEAIFDTAAVKDSTETCTAHFSSKI